MKPGPYFVILLLAVAGVVLAATLGLLAHANQKLQGKLQAQQQALSQGILGQQAQQISAGVLQDLAGAAAGNPDLRQLLEKYGYRVPAARPPAEPEAPPRSTSRGAEGRQPLRTGSAAPGDTGKEQRAPPNPEPPNPEPRTPHE